MGTRALRPGLARRGAPRPLVARAGVGHRLPRVRLRPVALGRRGRRPQPPLGARPCAFLERHDPPGAPTAAAAVHAGVLGVRRRPPRKRRPPGPCGRAGPRRRTPATPAQPARDERDAARDGVLPPAVRPVPDRPARRLRRGDGKDAALGRHRARDPRARRPCAPHRRDHRRPSRPRGGSHPRPACGGAAARDGPAGARGAPHAGGRRRGDPPADRRMGAAAARGLGGHGSLRPRRAAACGRAGAPADERRDRLPPLAGQRRPPSGGRRAAARAVRRPVRHRIRLRARAPGRRDVRRCRRGGRDARARGALVRRAQADGGAGGDVRGGRPRPRSRTAPTRITTQDAERELVIRARSRR